MRTVNLICDGSKTFLKLDASLAKELTQSDYSTLEYCIANYGYVNNCLGAVWEVSVQQWIRNINDVYDLKDSRTNGVVQFLTALTTLTK